MPYWGDPDFPVNLDDHQKVWRYINCEKYTDLLKRKKQFFTSGKKLQEMDSSEGYFQKMKFIDPPDRVDEISMQYLEEMDKKARYEDPKWVFINCWHINDDESDTMWKSGGGIDYSIVIQTTFKKLKKSFHDHIQRVDIKEIEYVDNEKSNISISWSPWRFSKKGEKYSHENELRILVEGISNTVRAVTWDDGKCLGYEIIPQDQIEPIDRNENGIWVKVDLNYFIETIHVSPLSQKQFLDEVKDITKKYGLDPNMVEKSTFSGKI